jgi:uncharacterized protein YukJ
MKDFTDLHKENSMSLHNYGVLIGHAVDFRFGIGKSPHYQIHMVDDEVDYRIAVNVKSQESPSEVEYLVDAEFDHPITDGLLDLYQQRLGFHSLKRPNDEPFHPLALDYIRGNLFPREKMRPLPFNVPGPDNDLNEELHRYIQRAIGSETAVVFAFGERWKSKNKKDKYFGFKPDEGIHDIHMNQGNVAKYKNDDGVRQDGGLFIYFTGEDGHEHWVAIFLKFQSQTWHTDDETGHRIGEAGEQEGQPTGEAGGAGTVRPPQRPADQPDGKVRILAAMVNPGGPDAGLETVTLLNTTSSPIDLTGWQLKDKFKKAMALQGVIQPGSTQVVTVTSPVELSNQGGIISVIDASGLKVDGVSYTRAQAKHQGQSIVF